MRWDYGRSPLFLRETPCQCAQVHPYNSGSGEIGLVLAAGGVSFLSVFSVLPAVL